MGWKKKYFKVLILNLWRLGKLTGLGKFYQLFLWEPENSKISNYLHCCYSYWLQLNAEQGQDTLTARATSGDSNETPPNSHCSTDLKHPIALGPQGYFSTEKPSLTWSSDWPVLTHTDRQSWHPCPDVWLSNQLPLSPEVFVLPPPPREEDQKSFTGLLPWTASKAAFPCFPTSQPKLLRHFKQHFFLHAGLSCSLV